MKEKDEYGDFSNVVQHRTYLTSEELPEGAYGSPINVNEPVKNKNTSNDDLKKDQKNRRVHGHN